MTTHVKLYNHVTTTVITKDALRAVKKIKHHLRGILFDIETPTMEKYHYQHFVRIYNRRKKQRSQLLTDAGYPSVKLNSTGGYLDAMLWCKQNLRRGSWVNLHHRFWFAYDNDAVHFRLIHASGL